MSIRIYIYIFIVFLNKAFYIQRKKKWIHAIATNYSFLMIEQIVVCYWRKQLLLALVKYKSLTNSQRRNPISYEKYYPCESEFSFHVC